ncbi:MAG: DUF2520 domain-containing protein [Flavobacteriales bacterium]|nr:DUF2520 domain-containing protein [Flavobacteriales bacterium]
MNKIILIGAGNVAHHLGLSLIDADHQILQVISKSKANAKHLAKKLNADFETELSKIKDADFALIAVNDDAIISVSNQIKNMPFAHTSGSVCLKKGGAFYPLQTFNKDIFLDLKKVPFCVSAKNKDLENTLLKVAKSISSKVYQIDEKQRRILHLAAVFACNFSNNMYAIAEGLLQKTDLDFEMLKPLIIETANKIKDFSPKSVQTGPAKRKDLQTIENQINLLEEEDLKNIYKLITNQIQK